MFYLYISGLPYTCYLILTSERWVDQPKIIRLPALALTGCATCGCFHSLCFLTILDYTSSVRHLYILQHHSHCELFSFRVR